METAAIGGTPKGGICRLTLTDLDRQVRDWFKARAEQLGCRVTVDDMGAMFARRDGTANVPPIAFGSHLDTQPTGGKFDGVLGTLAALEALRTLVEAGYETYAPIEVVNWTNEEGSRFAPAMVSSGVFAKVIEKDWAQSRQDRDGMTFAAALDAIGYRGTRALRRASAVGVLRTAHRAGADPGGRGQGHRRRHRRAGDALVRGDDHRAGRAHRRDADASAQERAARRRAAGRCGRRHRPEASAGCRHRRADREPAELAQCRAGRGVLHDRPAASRRRRARCDGVGRSRGAAGDLRAARPGLRRAADLGAARGALRCGLRGGGPPRGGTDRIFGARHRLGRRPRRGLCLARRAGRDDLRAVPRRHQPQRGGVFLQGAMRQGRAGAAAGGAGLRPACWPSAAATAKGAR